MAAGLLEVARVACELGGEAGRGVGEINFLGSKGYLSWDIRASVWAQREKVLLGKGFRNFRRKESTA